MRLVKLGGLLLGFAVTIYCTAYVARRPESNCEQEAVSEQWSADRAYKATVNRKSCNLGETLIYSARIDAYSTPVSQGWFVPDYELDDDEYPTTPPIIQWVSPRQLEIAVNTRTLTGSLSLHVGQDLTVVRRYIAREPAAFPN
jgi:hypothetical protein